MVSNTVNGRTFEVAAVVQRDRKVDPEKVYLDSKIREAIGAVSGKTVNVRADSKLPRQSAYGWVRSQFGVQVNMCRVSRTTSNDMELNIARLTPETLETIGAESGDTVILESTKKIIRIRSLCLGQRQEDYIRRNEENRPDIFPDWLDQLYDEDCAEAEKLDLPLVLIDLQTRLELGVEPGDPVRVYRSIRQAIANRIHLVSLPLIVSVIGALITLEMLDLYKMIGLGLGLVLIILLNFGQLKFRV